MWPVSCCLQEVGPRLQESSGLPVHPGRHVGPRLAAAGLGSFALARHHFPRSHVPGLPGCRVFPQAGYLAGQSWPALDCREGGRSMTHIVALPGGRTASYEIIGTGRPTLMFAGGPGFSAAYMNGDATLLSDVLCSYLIDPHGSGSSTPPASPAGYSPEGHARFYEEVLGAGAARGGSAGPLFRGDHGPDLRRAVPAEHGKLRGRCGLRYRARCRCSGRR